MPQRTVITPQDGVSRAATHVPHFPAVGGPDALVQFAGLGRGAIATTSAAAVVSAELSVAIRDALSVGIATVRRDLGQPFANHVLPVGVAVGHREGIADANKQDISVTPTRHRNRFTRPLRG